MGDEHAGAVRGTARPADGIRAADGIEAEVNTGTGDGAVPGAIGSRRTGTGEAPEVSRELETKFDVGPEFVLPDLTGLPGVARVGGPREFRLCATYLDTGDLRLARARLTLRRRTGGDDAGWHLKRPGSGGAREELRLPLADADATAPVAAAVATEMRRALEVPAALRELVDDVLAGRPLLPVVELRTLRTVHRLFDEAGRMLAEVADDQVEASVFAGAGTNDPAPGPAVPADPPGSAVPVTSAAPVGPSGQALPAVASEPPAQLVVETSAWREVEVELVDGDPSLIAVVGTRLLGAGAHAADGPSKLARALGDRLRRSPAPGTAAS